MSAASSYHPIFEHFAPYIGEADEGFTVDAFGVRVDQRLLDPTAKLEPRRRVHAARPICTGEGYFDLIAVARAVIEARDKFTMFELGAGYGYWLTQGAALARQKKLDISLVGVEGEPDHHAMMRQHLRNNGIDPDEHRIEHAAVAPEDGEVWFHTGDAHAWWGQSIAAPGTGARVRAVSLQSLLSDFDSVDLVHMDVQGVEADVLSASPAFGKVRRFVIGTHGRGIEDRLRTFFSDWHCEADYAMGEINETPYGAIAFGDGLQVWRRPT